MFVGQLAFTDADVSQEDDVVFLEVFWFFGKLFDVVGAIAGSELGMKKKAVHFDPGVTGKGVANEAVFPAGQGVDDEDADVLGLAGEGETAAVVVGKKLAAGGGKGEGEGVGAFLLEAIENGFVNGAAGGDGEVFGNLVAAGVAQANDGAEVAVERGADGEGDLHVFSHDAVGGCGDCDEFEVGEAGLGTDGDGEDGNVAQAILLGGGDGGLALVPVPVAEEDDGPEVGAVFEEVGERFFQVGAGLGAGFGIFGRGSEGLGGDGGFAVFEKGEVEFGRENFLSENGAGNDVGAGAFGIVGGIDGHHGAGVVGEDDDLGFVGGVEDAVILGLQEQEDHEGGDEKAQQLEKTGSNGAGGATKSGDAVEADGCQKKKTQPDKDSGSREMELVDLKLHQKGSPELLRDSYLVNDSMRRGE